MLADLAVVLTPSPEEVRLVQVFSDLDEADVAWIAANSERMVLEPWDVFLQPGAPADWMYLAIQGVLQARREQLGPNAPSYVAHAGDVFGALPYSRMTVFFGTGRALTEAVIARFPRALFSELLQRIPVLHQRFVWQLLDRVREATRRDAQFEKLNALGKLSAGLAHELNNPAAAVLRVMGEATARLDERGDTTAALIGAGVTAASVQQLDGLRRAAAARMRNESTGGKHAPASALAALDRSDQQDSLAVWLRDIGGARDPWSSASTFVDAGIERPALEAILDEMPPAGRGAAVRWLETGLAAQAFFHEADAAMRRITQLLDALQSYTNRDRMREMEDVDIREGIESTIALFTGRAREKGVRLESTLDTVPRIRAYPGDLNQVWSNLLDNALDAVLAQHGVVTVRTGIEGRCVFAEFRDNGPGVPADLRERIFEPFFTTKDVGVGTGLGLDIARRVVADLHGGDLTLQSSPGDTRFTVRLPLTTVGTFGL